MNLRPKAALAGFTPGDAFDNRNDAPRGFLGDAGKLPVLKKIFSLKAPENTTKATAPLGSGAYGIVCQTTNGVVKFDKSGSEARLYALLPTRLRNLSILPRNSRTGSLRLPPSWPLISCDLWNKKIWKKNRRVKISVIEREELSNLLDYETRTTRLTELGFSIVSTAVEDFQNRDPNDVRRAIYTGVLKWIKDNETLNLSQEQKNQLKHFGLCFLRFVKFGIIPRDMQARNMGQRADGSLVLRDLGVYIVLNDTLTKKRASVDAEKPRANVNGVVKRLRKLQEAPR